MKKKVMSLILSLYFMLQTLLSCCAVFAADAPLVTSISPSGDTVLKAAIGSVTFNTDMKRSTLTTENIVVTDVTNGNSVMTQEKTSAYDRAYTFICDFQPNTTYCITVSANVESVGGATLGEAYTHTFTTGEILYKAENVTPRKEANYTHNAGKNCSGDTSNARLVDLFDENISTKWYTYGEPTGKWVNIDLEIPVEIAYISYIPGMPTEGTSWASNVSVLASNDADFTRPTELTYTPTLTENDPYSSIEWTVAPTDTQKYRYIRIYKNSKNISLAEVAIYAFPGNPVITSVTPQGENVQKAAAAKITFDSVMDRASLTSENIVVTNVMNGGSVVPQKQTSVYDKSYAFVCDFQPNTTYRITVSQAVKSARGLPLESTYTHTFTTGRFLFGTENVTPKDISKYEHNSPNTSGSVNLVYDGKYTELWNTFGGSSPKYLQADLGEVKDLAYVSYHGKREKDNDSIVSDVKIRVSNDVNFADYKELAMTPTMASDVNSGLIEWIAVNDTNEAYRYIRLEKDSKIIYVAELSIYAYEMNPVVTHMSFGEDGAQDVTYARMMKIDFNSVMNRLSMTADSIVVQDNLGNIVPQTESYAYDKSYVFSCDFKSNTTYTVTVTTGVTSLGGTPLADEVTYTFTTGYVAPVKNVMPWDDSCYTTSSGEFRGEYGGAQAIYTGGPNDETYDYMPDGATAWIQTGLGKKMPIAYISYLPRNTGLTAEQFKGDMRGSAILVSNDPTFATYEQLDIVPEYYENEPPQKGIYWKFVTETPGASYRYIRVQNKSYVFISELTVYAYQNVIEIKSADEITQIAKADECTIHYYGVWGDLHAGESVTFVADVTSKSTQPVQAKVYAAVYDEDTNGGKKLVAVSEGTAGEATTVNLPQGITNAEVKFFIITDTLTPLMANVVKKLR